MKKVTVELPEGQPVKVKFEGDYITKRELALILRAVKREHLYAIKDYRRQRIIEEYEQQNKKVEVTNGTVTSGTTSVAGTTEAGRTSEAGKPAVDSGRAKADTVSTQPSSIKPAVTAGRVEVNAAKSSV